MTTRIVLCVVVLLWGCDTVPLQVGAEVQDEAVARQRQEALAQALSIDPDTGVYRFVGETHYVIMSNFQFSPSLIRLQSGAVVRIRLSNSSWVTHYFGAVEFFSKGAEVVNVLESKIPPGQHHIPVAPFTERDLYLFVKEPGEYPINCFLPSHRKEGMYGRLIVEPLSSSL